MVSVKNVLWTLVKFRTPLIVIAIPLMLLPLPLTCNSSPESLVAFLMIMMGVYWCTDIIPIPVTALIPIIYLPLTGVMKTQDVAVNYMKDLILLMLGGLMVALAIERSGLHKRVALFILKTIGVEQKRLLFGFMFATWLLSMFISNTAATAMMLPIADSVVKQLLASDTNNNRDSKRRRSSQSRRPSNGYISHTKEAMGMDDMNGHTQEEPDYQIRERAGSDIEEQPEEVERTAGEKSVEKAFTLAIPYAANIGGTAFLTGTPPNLVVKSQVERIWEETHGLKSPITFTAWTIYALPTAVTLLILIWIYLVLFYITFRWSYAIDMYMFYMVSMTQHMKGVKQTKDQQVKASRVIRDEWNALGNIRWAECAVGIVFIILILLWFLRDPQFIEGWSIAFKDGYLKDAIPAIFMAIVLFVIPMEHPRWMSRSDKPIEFLMDWDTVHHKMSWGVIPLLGGGLALADAASKSGLSAVISDQLKSIGSLNGWLVVGILCLAVAMLTEVTSNTATCNLLMPVMELLSVEMGKSPLYLMMPIAVTTSFAFMLPVATPPNAIAFATGKIKIMDMVMTGALLNVICAVIVTVMTNTWAYSYFDMGTIPWNTTTT